ncbi:MAG: SUMF1/EgtB/PvdO family nonheme iron enzyme, partial [Myxococcota bacterium]
EVPWCSCAVGFQSLPETECGIPSETYPIDFKCTLTPFSASRFCSAPRDVRSNPPNPFGLYDMDGNLREWTHDRWDEDQPPVGIDPFGPESVESCISDEEVPLFCRTLRGGDWQSRLSETRGVSRAALPETVRDFKIGFRVARTTPTQEP